MGSITIDNEVLMQSRLNMLIRLLGVENGDRNLELDFRSTTEWAIDVSHAEGEVDDHGAELFEIHHRQFIATSLAEAVRKAWEFYGSPVECSACQGEGSFVRWMEPGSIFQQHPDEQLAVHHDGSVSMRRDCTECGSEGYHIASPADDGFMVLTDVGFEVRGEPHVGKFTFLDESSSAGSGDGTVLP